MKLLIATNNLGKVRDFRSLLPDAVIFTLNDIPGYKAPEETGKTFKENALIKAKAALDYTGLPTIADDSGLVVPALGGAPGVYSARYCGYHGDDDANNRRLLEEMEELEGDDRYAYYEAVICYCLTDGTVLTGVGRCEGHILREYVGDNGFGYDPIFFVKDAGKSMAQLTVEEKNKISHRAKALQSLTEDMSVNV